MRTACFLLALSLSAGAALAQPSKPDKPQDEAPAPLYTENVDVVGATPIHSVGIDRNRIPANVQTASAGDLAPGVHLGEQLVAEFGSVGVNEAQNNPFQPDILFRGFAASPLLGLPQGIAVYQDGVRLNEPFGDTVHWDLLPANAISGVNLIPGSNPLFGLNTLGGALSLQTKTGFSHAGHGITLSGGSFDRRWVDVQSAGSRGSIGYFVAGRFLTEDGWRDHSPARVRQLFGNVEWRGATRSLTASVTAGSNRLIGNGAAPEQLLEIDRKAIFTHPDETKTQMALVTLRGRQMVSRDVLFDAVVFYRPSTIRTFNGDDTDYDECEDEALEGLLCEEEGEGDAVVDQFGRLVPADEDSPLNGTNNTSRTRTRGWGAAFQTTVTRPLAGRANHFLAGVSVDRAGSRYQADTELARLTDERGTVGSGLLDSEAAVRLRTSANHAGLYVADFFSPVPRLTLAGSARFNRSTIVLRDQIGDDLNGNHEFTSVNPSAGATFSVSESVSLFGSFSLASRVPTPSELSCADPDDPCRLPNAFVADPPLEQVVARTWEGGARGQEGALSWTAAAFRTTSRDDIVFISSGALTNEGHFANVGDTLRRGLELHVAATAGTVRLSGAYTYLRATFNTPLTLASPNHPDEVDGEIAVSPGDSLPGVPRHLFKGGLAVTAGRASFGANLVAMSSQYLRGDEANLLDPIDASGIVNVSGAFALHRQARLVARVSNLFDTRYSTFGLLGEADDVLGDDFDDPRFLSPGAPRAAWVGIELSIR